MTEAGYPAAHLVAPRIRQHFVRHLERSGREGASLDQVPPLEDIEAVVDAAFWASLRREEGYVPRISIALVPPNEAAGPLYFAQPLKPTPLGLTKIAPAVERPGIHLGVWRIDGVLKVWGAVRSIPDSSPVFEVAAPGLLVVKHQRGDGGKFVNVAVLEGDQVKIIVEDATAIPDCPAVLWPLLGKDVDGILNPRINVVVDLAVSMRAHGRGGILLLVPGGNDWTESIIKPIPYSVAPPFGVLSDLVKRAPEERTKREWQEELEDAVAAIAGLTAVDGATLINDRSELLAFGAKITRRDGWPIVEQVTITEPIEGGEGAIVHPTRIGGTRHMAAAQFVHDQRGAVALVASQDGRFTVFAWSTHEQRVHAHRVETLLL